MFFYSVIKVIAMIVFAPFMPRKVIGKEHILRRAASCWL